MDDLFAPPGEAWRAVSPRLATARRLLLLAFGLPLAAVGTAAAWVLGTRGIALAVAAAGVLLLAWGWWLVGRNVRAWGYAERDDELFITRGVLYRGLVVVPYGRMQYVDVQAGPIDQALGIAKVVLHTAAPGTSAVIPGLPAEEAAHLRDRLTALGEVQAAGL